MPRRFIAVEAMAGVLLLCTLTIGFDLSHVLLNQTALSVTQSFVSNRISVGSLGLHLKYSKQPLIVEPRIASKLPVACESIAPRLAVYAGIIQFTSGNFDGASRCFSWALAVRPGMPDAEILLVSSYHLADRPMDSLRVFEQLPKEAQSIPAVAAQALLDYAVTSPSDATLTPSGSFRGIIPRAVLFDLLDSYPAIASRFLDEAFSAGLFSPADRSDFDSIVAWSARSGQVDVANVEEPRLRGRDELMSELQIAAADALGCGRENVSIGPEIVLDDLFSSSSSIPQWRNLVWTSGAADTYNRGGFKWGWDLLPEGVNIGAMRISGLWKEEDPQLYPASASVQFDTPLRLQRGKSLYLMYVRYKTEHLRDGKTTIWFDSADYRRFVGTWRLPLTSGAWRELYALGYADSDVSPVAHPMISHSALGTVWIDQLMVVAVHSNDCFVAQDVKLVGELHGTSTR